MKVKKTITKKSPKSRSSFGERTSSIIWASAGGICSMPKCKIYLLENYASGKKSKHGEIAHIVGEKEGIERRGDYPLDKKLRNKPDNLMLLCHSCHKMIDETGAYKTYTVEILREIKKEHEEHIKRIISLKQDEKTTVLRLLGKIRGNYTSITPDEIAEAIFKKEVKYPSYISGERIIEIDLQGIDEADYKSYIKQCITRIDTVFQRQFTPAIEDKTLNSLSVFAFARIPLLVYLGSLLGDKIPTTLYDKKKTGNQNWIWESQEVVCLETKQLLTTTESNEAVLLLEFSGDIVTKKDKTISLDKLPEHLRTKNIYLIRPKDIETGRLLPKSYFVLEAFRREYETLLRNLESTSISSVHLIPAIPIPIGIACGRELLRDLSPNLIVYDLTADSTYEPIITVKKNGELQYE
jgi:predicted metal-binding protein